MNSTHPFCDILTTRFKARVVRELIGSARYGNLLDVGCGSAYMLSQTRHACEKAFGVDMAVESLSFGGAYVDACLSVANAEQLPFRDDVFDCVISTDAFEHFPDDRKAACEVRRVIRDDGCLILYVPSEQGVLSNSPFVHLYHATEENYMLDQRYYTIKSLRKLVEDRGFVVEYAGFHNVFVQEFCTQMLKWVSLCAGKRYEQQVDITAFTGSRFFPIYRWIILPVVTFLVRIEEFIFERLFGGHVRGHRVVLKCRPVS
jgi:ubiquinone/menaquinone biosynthesis C-methylase UbiE